MFEKFRDDARDVLRLAREEALQLGSPCIGTEHLLLALTKAENGIPAAVLKNLGVNAARVMGEIRRRGPRLDAEPPVPGRMPFSPNAVRSFATATRIASSPGEGFVGQQHLFLALLEETEGAAAQILTAFGLNPAEVHDMVSEILSPGSAAPREARSLFGDLTQSTREAMYAARSHAVRLGCEFIGREHILLAILDEGRCGADLLARTFGIDLMELRADLERRLAESASTTVTRGQLPFSPRVTRTLQLAADACRALAHDALCTEHLVLGLLKSIELDDSGPAPEALRAVGLRLAPSPTAAAKKEVETGFIRRRWHSGSDENSPSASS